MKLHNIHFYFMCTTFDFVCLIHFNFINLVCVCVCVCVILFSGI